AVREHERVRGEPGESGAGNSRGEGSELDLHRVGRAQDRLADARGGSRAAGARGLREVAVAELEGDALHGETERVGARLREDGVGAGPEVLRRRPDPRAPVA